MLTTNKHGGSVGVSGKTGVVELKGGEDSGSVSVTGKMGIAELQADEDTGWVGIGGKSGNVWLSTDRHGGWVGVYGNNTDKTRAIMGVGKSGNGAVSTWDKNGNRLATLK